MRRRFSRRERIDLWLSQDGKCALTGQPLDPGFHADHKNPWSKGGLTAIENGQALTPEENLKKGARMPKRDRFEWQNEFVKKWQASTAVNFFLCALPGAGKTRASGRVIRLWIEQGGVVVIVVPTLPIRRNWRSVLRTSKIYVDENFYGHLKQEYQGVVVTYMTVANNTGVYKKLCADKPVLVVCDEIHHASEGENSRWGEGLRDAFEHAHRRLLLSGTPVRSDTETTTWLDIEDFIDDDGKHGRRYRMDFCYDWPRALTDQVVRTVTFHRIKMDTVKVQYPKQDELKTFTSKDDAWLTYALDDRDFLLAFLKQANTKLTAERKADPTAAGLVVAKNIFHATIIFELLELLGQKPIMVHSKNENDESSLEAIEAFKNSTDRHWMVSVRQISEGVDVPRFRVEAYLTNYATDLTFRQLIGRVVRRREHETDDQAQAHVFIPDTPRLVEFANKIEKLQALALINRREEDDGGGDGGAEDEDRGYGTTIGGSQPEFSGYIIRGKQYEGDRASVLQQLMEKYQCPEHSAMLMMEDGHGLQLGQTAEEIEPVIQQTPPWEREEMLKADCNNRVRELTKLRLYRRHGGANKHTPKEYSAMISAIHVESSYGIQSKQPKMSISELERKKARLIEMLMHESAKC